MIYVKRAVPGLLILFYLLRLALLFWIWITLHNL